jgi:predicted nucleotidyltransferase component of viral defense system
MKKGSPISIKATLKNVADNADIAFQNIIIRYFHERLLYRIANSEYSNNFILKGGALLYAFEGILYRPTIDVDISAKQISNDKEQIKQFFQKICDIKYDDDCVIFDINSVETTEISEDDKYAGVRVFVTARLDTIKQRLQIDIGFGDVITPAPINLTYPVLLDGLAKPEIKAYSIETVIAEKFQAMVQLGTVNSRMKDFYDVYVLLKNNNVCEDTLKEAIFQTFKHRNTTFVKDHELFSEEFYTNQNRQIMWKAFLKKMKIADDLEFSIVVGSVLGRLKAIYDELHVIAKT